MVRGAQAQALAVDKFPSTRYHPSRGRMDFVLKFHKVKRFVPASVPWTHRENNTRSIPRCRADSDSPGK